MFAAMTMLNSISLKILLKIKFQFKFYIAVYISHLYNILDHVWWCMFIDSTIQFSDISNRRNSSSENKQYFMLYILVHSIIIFQCLVESSHFKPYTKCFDTSVCVYMNFNMLPTVFSLGCVSGDLTNQKIVPPGTKG